ncbi:hypothetical protein [Streptomyces collinus]|uniref:hypothetical protein n=1 Tax=Streptomyces collinus TaxID=42684 RepID=UPI003629CFA5
MSELRLRGARTAATNADAAVSESHGSEDDCDGVVLASDLRAVMAIHEEAKRLRISPKPRLQQYNQHRDNQWNFSQPYLVTIARRLPELADLIEDAYIDGHDILTVAQSTAELRTTLSALQDEAKNKPRSPQPDPLERYRDRITPGIMVVAAGAAATLTARLIDDSPALLRAAVARLYGHGTVELLNNILATVTEDAQFLRSLARQAAGPFEARSEGEAAYLARVTRAELETEEHAIAQAWAYRMALYAAAYPEARPDLEKWCSQISCGEHPAAYPVLRPIRPVSGASESPLDADGGAVASAQTSRDRSTLIGGDVQTVNISYGNDHKKPAP